MGKFETYNAENVLAEVETLLAEIEDGSKWQSWEKPRYYIDDVCDRLSIFDWWVNYLGKSHLKQMRTFLRAAIKRGFTGYVCFKVGATGCANGMWAHKTESTYGSSPNDDFIYRSFTPEYVCWQVRIGGVVYPSGDDWNSCTDAGKLDNYLYKIGMTYDGKQATKDAPDDGNIILTPEMQAELLTMLDNAKKTANRLFECDFDSDKMRFTFGCIDAMMRMLDKIGIDYKGTVA